VSCWSQQNASTMWCGLAIFIGEVTFDTGAAGIGKPEIVHRFGMTAFGGLATQAAARAKSDGTPSPDGIGRHQANEPRCVAICQIFPQRSRTIARRSP
jgi:hypothetical protein